MGCTPSRSLELEVQQLREELRQEKQARHNGVYNMREMRTAAPARAMTNGRRSRSPSPRGRASPSPVLPRRHPAPSTRRRRDEAARTPSPPASRDTPAAVRPIPGEHGSPRTVAQGEGSPRGGVRADGATAAVRENYRNFGNGHSAIMIFLEERDSAAIGSAQCEMYNFMAEDLETVPLLALIQSRHELTQTLKREATQVDEHADYFMCLLILNQDVSLQLSSYEPYDLVNGCKEIFNSTNCPALKDKPKLFFIMSLEGRPAHSGDNELHEYNDMFFLRLYPRTIYHAVQYLHSLVEVLQKHYKSWEFSEIINSAKYLFQRKFTKDTRSRDMLLESTLQRRLYLFPKGS